MTQKCVHKGCEKTFDDPEEGCVYHSGSPIFHEGQKGWKCCKPRVLTFDEFLRIPPCTTGKHATVIDLPSTESRPKANEPTSPPAPKPISTDAYENVQATPQFRVTRTPPPAAFTSVHSESEDDPLLPVPPNIACQRRGCNVTSSSVHPSREGEECIHHPGHALFHEGSKGWTCCKKRVLEFDAFMSIQGCKIKDKHLFIGKKKDRRKEEAIGEVRHDFYQTPTTVIASVFLKNIDRLRAKVDFSSSNTVDLDLPTGDNRRYNAQIPLFGQINVTESKFKIMKSKLELILVKTDGVNWRALRSDEQGASGILQVGRAGRA